MNIVNTQIMQYPLISEYVDAIRSAEDNLDKLRDLRPVFDSNGTPIMSSGNFAVVFKMRSERDDKLYALKCFTKEQEGREEAYRQIADKLEFVQSTYLAKVRYYDHELFVDTNSSDDSEFPVLLMDWVEGETLDRYVRRNINDTYALEMLTYNFSRLAMWLLPQPFAHGDLKPDNILVQTDGSLTLVDYDGMYVPAMQGQKARELGSPDFRHPLRTENDFNEHIDDFPVISILLSLRLIAADPSLLDSYGASDRLLFAESDYRDLSSCALLKNVFPSHDVDINTLVSLFTIADMHKSLSHVSFRLLTVKKPQKPEKIEIEEEELSTKVTKEDLANAAVDEFGAKYSNDGKRLLKVPSDIKEYKIKDGTKVICDSAFSGCKFLQEIFIPLSVTAIGMYAFDECESLRKIILPANLKTIKANPFLRCKCKIFSNSPYFKVKDNVLYNENMGTLISYLSNNINFKIPNSVKSIDTSAFGYSELINIFIPESIISIGNAAFEFSRKLREIIIPTSVKSIKKNPFEGCKCSIKCNSKEYIVENNILYNANKTELISYTSNISSFYIPQSVIKIRDLAFASSLNIQYLYIPSSVKNIGNCAFFYCLNLSNIYIESSIGLGGLNIIGYAAFWGCVSLQTINLRYTKLKEIDHDAFAYCKRLKEISFPETMMKLGDNLFNGCINLLKIGIPIGSRAIFEKMLPEHKYKLVEEELLLF